MRTVLALFALIALGGGSAFAQDPVVVDSNHYTVMFENDQVRVLKIRYGPNEESVMHEHPAGVAVYLGDMRGQFTLPDGQVLEVEGKAGDAIWTDAGAHLPKNLSDQPFEVVVVELKTPPPGAE